jgi:hypothetical protein
VAVFLLVLTPCWSQQTEKFTLRHAGAPGLAGWMQEELDENGELAGIPADQIDKIECIPQDNAIAVSGEEAAIERIRMLLAQVDVPITQIAIRCKMVELEEPELLLGEVGSTRQVTLADGSRVEVTPKALARERPGWPLSQDETGPLVAINPHVNLAALAVLVATGRATMVNELRITVFQGIPGYIGFATEHEGKVYGPYLRFTATMTTDDLITVEASLPVTEPPHAGVLSANVHMDVRHTARTGQTVAVGVLPKSEAPEAERGIVFLLTAEPVREPAE